MSEKAEKNHKRYVKSFEGRNYQSSEKFGSILKASRIKFAGMTA